MKCPVCNGAGFIAQTLQEQMEQKRAFARKMKEDKVPLRTIAKLLGYKSVSSVAELLKD
jgi:hypothetical protein